ncbi:MAG: hydroxylamine reductase [Candidatus Omnitrophica bacterium]|nr:hydroxylamine reductase [Candidatus Omnitrophota bacterium]
MEMFCRQCEQTMKGQGCHLQKGVCGKTAPVADLQDVLVHLLKQIAWYESEARKIGMEEAEVARFLAEGLFTTVTNVNFDEARLEADIIRARTLRDMLKARVEERGDEKWIAGIPSAVLWEPGQTREQMLSRADEVGIMSDPELDEDIRSLREILLYGLKGMAAYAHHALLLGKEDIEVNRFFSRGLAALVDDSLNADDLVKLIFEFGSVNLKCLELLDAAHTGRFGHPEPTEVALGVKKGPAIIVSGHDLLDLAQLLEQTEGKGINIYTHGEMLPAHGYPELKKYPHFAGHFGSAWQNQQKEFDGIPAVILMTTNCIQEPKSSYIDRIFTTGLVAWPGIAHIPGGNEKKDFSPVIEKAFSLGGFKDDRIEKTITVGFGHHAVLGVADKVLDLVKQKKIKRFFLIGGCDGAKPGRNYYTEFAEKVPEDCVILTLACGKFRINRLDLGTIGGIPRLLDCGQCNDSYSAIKIASGLAEALGCGVNDLPLSFIISWYEQKAVCILLTLFSLDVRNIVLGPSLPAFVSSNVLKVLREKFNIRPAATAEEDVKAEMGA